MKIKLFYHSLLSDWNHGNAHFLRGVATELIRRGNLVEIYEPENSWSLTNLIADNGNNALQEFQNYYPELKSTFYNIKNINLDKILFDADLVLVHEWNEHELVKKIGEKSKKYSFRLLFHDTHHRAVTEKKKMEAYDLVNYDGVLAFGEIIKNIYLKEGWTKKAWTWHEAADTNIFKPFPKTDNKGDVVWIGNWGDDERTKELHEFLIEPVKELNLKAKMYGVRYPELAKNDLMKAGIEYGGWLPNFKAPEMFSKYKFTVHVPRRPYVQTLPGIPTIRPFEAMACGIPLISAPWNDVENLFEAGKDYLAVNNKMEMLESMKKILNDEGFANQISEHGIKTIHAKHTCVHRVNELYDICEEIAVNNFAKESIA